MSAPASRWTAGGCLLALALAACDGVTDARRLEVRSVEVEETGPLVRTLRVELARADSLAVEYWTEGAPRLRARSPSGTAHEILLARLRAGRSYRWRIPGSDREGTFATAPLPAELGALRLEATGTPTTPLVLLHLFHPAGFRGYAAVDGAGEVVWYWRGEGVAFGMTRRANGNFVFLDQLRGLVEVTPAGAVVRELAQDAAGRGEMHHDVIATSANTLLVIAFDRRDFEGAPLLGDAVWEWSPEAGTMVRRWSAWDHFSPASDRGPRFGTEWLHANALALGPRGNLLVSVHYWNQVLSLAPGFGSVEWRLGGVNATIAVPPEERFTGQHTAREVAPGRVVLFDNRHEQGGTSRAVEFELVGSEARRVWEWRPERANWASVVSSARRLPGGSTLVGFGTSAGLAGGSGPIEVYEVSPDGQTAWHLEVGGPLVMYRAEPLKTLAGEEEVPP